MFNDMVLSRDGPINGYVVVFDMQGVCLRHLTLVQFGALRNFMSYIQVSSTQRSFTIFQLIKLFSRPTRTPSGGASGATKEDLRHPHGLVHQSGVRHRKTVHQNRVDVAFALHHRRCGRDFPNRNSSDRKWIELFSFFALFLPSMKRKQFPHDEIPSSSSFAGLQWRAEIARRVLQGAEARTGNRISWMAHRLEQSKTIAQREENW